MTEPFATDTRDVAPAAPEAAVETLPVRGERPSVPPPGERLREQGRVTTTSVGGRADPAEPLNAFTVDVEDWLQAVVDPRLELTDHFRANTRRVLEALALRGVKGTFFVLGLAAGKAPDIVREIHNAGHEIQSHGYGHELLYALDRARFRADVERSKKLLEDLIGESVIGYRAPAFTVTRATLWALDVLVECGFQYDCSIFPMRVRHYGIDGAPWYPHRARTPAGYEIVELPVATYRIGGRTLPIGGGGYFRLFPYAVLSRGLRQINRARQSATVYVHPHEFDPAELCELDHPISWTMRLHQGLGRRGLPRKVDRLLAEFPFGTARRVIASLGDLPRHEYRRPAG